MATIRSAYDGVRVRKQLVFDKPSRTKTSFKEECDINNILDKYQKTGLVAHVKKYNGDYSDVADGLTYHESMNVVVRAQEVFNTLPSKVRSRFGNDPRYFFDFVNDPQNVDELVSLGLKVKPVVQAAPGAAPVVGAAAGDANKPPTA